jgi:hypothetical protein
MNGSTPKFARCDTRKPDGFYVEFARITLDDDHANADAWGVIDCGDPEYRKEDQKRLASHRAGDWHFVGIRAQARCMIVRNGVGTFLNIDSPGLWAIESDSGEEYFAEVFRDECEELKGMLAAMTEPQYEEA